MAAYPSYAVALASTPTPENDYIDDVSSSGLLHSRQFHDKIYTNFDVIHPGLTGQQFYDLRQTYISGPRDTYTGFTWYTSSPAESYSVQFTAPPEIAANHGNDRYDVRVQLRGWVT